MSPASPPSLGPSRRSRLFRVVFLGGVVIAVLIGIGVLALREPRFNGRTAVEWLDAVGTNGLEYGRGSLRDHPMRKELEEVRNTILPSLERELRRAAFAKMSGRDQFLTMSRLWVELGRLFPNRLGLRAPSYAESEVILGRRLTWGTGLILDLSPDLVSGLARFEALAGSVPTSVLIEASLGFGHLVDADGALEAALVQRIQSNSVDSARRALWISCLGHLGPQASSSADLVRSWTRDPDSEVRRNAIMALGTLDTRDDTVAFVRSCANSVEGRQAAMMAFMRMGARAQPAEDFIRETLKDPDMVTSMFAKFTLDRLASITNAPASP